MRYVFIDHSDKVIREKEISYEKVCQIIASEHKNNGKAIADKILDLKKYGWITLSKVANGTIEHRKY